jgi:TonB family protein
MLRADVERFPWRRLQAAATADACYSRPAIGIKRRRATQSMKSRWSTAAALSLALGPAAFAAGEAGAPTGKPAPLTVKSSSLLGTDICADKFTPPGFVAAVLKTRSLPEYPEADAADENEGWVRLGFTIDVEGDTKNIVVLDKVGSQNMARAARLAVARWKYKPATENGVVVEQYGNTAELLFRDQKIGKAGIHDAVVAKFDEARGLIAAGKYSEGIPLLEQTFALPLTLFERARVSFALAFAFEKSNDPARALGHIRHALIEKGSFLEQAMVPAAQRQRLRLEVANGNFHYAACAPPLPAADKFDPTGAERKDTAKIVDDAVKKLTSGTPLTIDATLTADAAGGDSGVWEHPLSRRKFKFSTFTGVADAFRLSCVRQLSSGAPNETQEWSVPASAGLCTLRVTGTVGATFKLVEEW